MPLLKDKKEIIKLRHEERPQKKVSAIAINTVGKKKKLHESMKHYGDRRIKEIHGGR